MRSYYKIKRGGYFLGCFPRHIFQSFLFDTRNLSLRCSQFYSNREDVAVENIELICLEVKKPKSKPLLIATWYRPPNSSIELFSDFEKFLQLLDDENKEIIITGDLNCNLLEQTRSQVTSRLLDVMDMFQLQQHIQTPTRITPTALSLIDVIITQIGDSKTLETGAIQLGISDHSLVHLCRKICILLAVGRHLSRDNCNFFL